MHKSNTIGDPDMRPKATREATRMRPGRFAKARIAAACLGRHRRVLNGGSSAVPASSSRFQQF
eukprot:10147102-Alexandrium_andersonii.AAC.1